MGLFLLVCGRVFFGRGGCGCVFLGARTVEKTDFFRGKVCTTISCDTVEQVALVDTVDRVEHVDTVNRVNLINLVNCIIWVLCKGSKKEPRKSRGS